MELKILPPFLKGSDKNNDFGIRDKSLKYGLPPGKPQIISSAHGKIKTLLLVFPKDGKTKNYNYWEIFKELVQKMDTVEKIIVIYHENEFNQDGIVPRIPYNNNRIYPVEITKPSHEISHWIQDLFYPVIYTKPNHPPITCLVSSSTYLYSSTVALNSILKKYFGSNSPSEDHLILRDSPLPFQGGNMLVGSGFILMGADSQYQNGLDYTTSYETWFGITPIFLKSRIPIDNLPKEFIFNNVTNKIPPNSKQSMQPLFHIDMFISLAGFNKKGEYILVVGEPTLGVDLPMDINNSEIKRFYHWFSQISSSINSIIDQLLNTPNIKFKIVRNPLVLIYEDNKNRERNWMWATYNNCLVEIIENKYKQTTSKKVWLPSYGGSNADYSEYTMPYSERSTFAKQMDIPTSDVGYGDWSNLSKYDHQNQKIWTDLGFEVCLLQNNYIPLIHGRGSLNCITNCIKRG
ncbi:hypothetical protein [Aureispira anguillae]|uniref:Uncharacterized protein n=1 Tax=Aureispira anguillae TaxID=2864201 RepID=A0A915YB35_9BACT|nr:hypothetical protein [Aureispira anguillae]BDS09809.1 hypothetical protein AsAng_0005140 [Aureispira anguillae]